MSARVPVHTSVFRIYINHMMTEDRYYDSISTMDFIRRVLHAGTYPWKSASVFESSNILALFSHWPP